MERVIIQWTTVARDGLAKLPKKVRRGILDKANEIRDAKNPSKLHKPLSGPLGRYYRITYSRYRAIYRVDREKLAGGDAIQKVYVLFVAVGIRNAGDKNDIYRLAQKLVEMGLIPETQEREGDEAKEGN
jgi:mRNA interferase RelE/StbE